MKKLLFASSLVASALIFFNCQGTKKAASSVPKLTYDSNVKTAVMMYCTPCHVPSKGGKIKPYDNYANAKSDIDEIIRRIELNPGDRGFMPFKHPKLSDSVINVFKQWRADGMLEN